PGSGVPSCGGGDAMYVSGIVVVAAVAICGGLSKWNHAVTFTSEAAAGAGHCAEIWRSYHWPERGTVSVPAQLSICATPSTVTVVPGSFGAKLSVMSASERPVIRIDFPLLVAGSGSSSISPLGKVASTGPAELF